MSLEAIEERILHDARVEAETVLNKAKEEAKEIIRTATFQAENARTLLLRSEEIKTEISCNQILSQARMDSRKMVREARDACVEKCLTLAKEHLEMVRTSPGYPGIFQHLLEEGLEILDVRNAEITVHPADRQLGMDLLDFFAREGVILTLSEERLEGLGGVVLRAPDLKVEVNNTFEARQERLQRALLIEISGMLFPAGGDRGDF